MPDSLEHFSIGGLVKNSFVDFPGKIAAVVFTRGCNFRCLYCHNPDLVLSNQNKDSAFSITLSDTLAFLKKRQRQLEGVVVCGGEPTLQPNLIPFLQQLKTMNYLVKLDTNGSQPHVLLETLQKGLVDFVAMDFKAPLSKYSQVVGPCYPQKIEESLAIIQHANIPHEIRTTAVKPLHTLSDLLAIGQMAQKAYQFVLQRFVNGRLLNTNFSKIATPFSDTELESIKLILEDRGIHCIIR